MSSVIVKKYFTRHEPNVEDIKCNDKHENPCEKDKITCVVPRAVQQNPPGDPPIVPPPFPLAAYGLATIDTGNNVLYIGGLQGFKPDGNLPNTVAERVKLAYDSMFAIARYYGSSAKDALRFVLYVNPNSAIMSQDPATKDLNFEERFVYVRNTANAIQASIYGVNGPVPARTIVGVTYIVLDDCFELESTYIIPQPLPKCKNSRIPHVEK